MEELNMFTAMAPQCNLICADCGHRESFEAQINKYGDASQLLAVQVGNTMRVTMTGKAEHSSEELSQQWVDCILRDMVFLTKSHVCCAVCRSPLVVNLYDDNYIKHTTREVRFDSGEVGSVSNVSVLRKALSKMKSAEVKILLLDPLVDNNTKEEIAEFLSDKGEGVISNG